MSPTLITAARVILPDAVLEPGWVETDGSTITAAGPGLPAREPDFSFADGTLAPGFVDAHIHGGGGFSFNDADPAAAAARIADVHRSHGTTTLMASLVTAPLPQLEKAVAALAPLVEQGVLAGIHLEGPWLSPDHRGAHAAELLLVPAPAAIDRLMLAGRGTVRMVTIAPELEGGLAAIRQITGYGAVAAIGHTGAGYDLAREAIAAGATAGTHVFNAMRPLHHREPGPALALLEDPSVFAEVIADGVHLHPSLIRFIAASPARAVFVTDAMAAACAQEGTYQLGGLDVRVSDGEARLVSDGTIAGSILTLDAAVRHAVLEAGIPLADAVRAASQNPADMLGLTDVGRIEAGRQADLVVLTPDLEVAAVMKAGRWLSPTQLAG
ncbi:N-acetylglucosamine-6-phosphate deacetylase [Arthrobacter sp. NPDC056493]|uniref:N-acetylglucosamine-6-phosphate deacetylase n=1 Tax=Arthrobacter sp. NPDC056493 TaxID=3345839 RepID=UPI00366C7D3A